MNTDIDQLRESYLSRGPFPFDRTVESHFSQEELSAIEKYGYWFDAIWEDRVPLVTDKLKHFYLAKNRHFEDRTSAESLWFKYKSLVLPF